MSEDQYAEKHTSQRYQEVRGVIIGVLPVSKEFEARLSDGKIITGTVVTDVSVAKDIELIGCVTLFLFVEADGKYKLLGFEEARRPPTQQNPPAQPRPPVDVPAPSVEIRKDSDVGKK